MAPDDASPGSHPRGDVTPPARRSHLGHVALDRWSISAADAVVTHRGAAGALDAEMLGADRTKQLMAVDPSLDEPILTELRSRGSSAIVTRPDDGAPTLTWVSQGTVPIPDLGSTVDVPAHEHLIEGLPLHDRSAADLVAAVVRMVAAELVTSPEHHLVALLAVDDRQGAEVLAGLGWRRTGREEAWSIAGHGFRRSRRHPARPPVLPSGGSGEGPAPAILVGGESWGSTLRAARSLGAIGAAAHVISTGRGADVFARSRHIVGTIDLDVASPDDLVDAIARLVDSEPGSAPIPVIPTTDRDVDLLDRARHRLPDRVRLAMATSATVRPLLHKARSMEIAAQAGIEVPAHVVLAEDSLDPASPGRRRTADIELPVIIRPTAWNTTGDRYFKLVVARTARERDAAIDTALASGAEIVVQHYLEGPEDAVELAIVWRSSDGTRTAVCTGRKCRSSSPEGGVMAWGEAASIPDVEEAARAFLDESGFVGLGGIEFIRHGGRLHYVEFNPRLEAIHFLAAAAGVDTVALAYRDLALDERPATEPRARPATAWIGSAWLDRLRRRPADLRLAVEARREFGRHPARIRSVWDPTDPQPALAVVRRLLTRGIDRRPVTR